MIRHIRKQMVKMMVLSLLCTAFGCSASTAAITPSAQTASSTPSPAVSTAPASPSLLPASSSFTATFIDVGQGDSTLIQCDGKAMLIDGGEPSQSQKIYAILKEKGISNLDYIVCSHTHSDHAGGLSGALQYASCAQALLTVTSAQNGAFTDLINQLNQHAVPITVPQVGDVYSLGSATFKVLGPTDMEEAMDENDKSMVLRFDYGSTSFLFTGDAEQEEQQLLMYHDYDELKVNVLKADHHGSSNGASYAWIKAVQPAITVISCGKGNSYGHPHAETLNLLKQYGSSVYRTDLQGDITVISDGSTVTASVSRNADADVWQSGDALTSAAASAAAPAATPVPAAAGTYVANKNTKKFHYPNCTAVSKMSAKNRWDFTGDRQELINQGYVPCKICNP